MQIADVREAVRDAIAAHVTGAGALPLTVYSYVPDDGPTPFAYVQVEGVTFDRAMSGGSVELMLTVMCMASRADDVTAQKTIDALLSDTGVNSIREAIANANDLTGATGFANDVADFAHVVGSDAPPRWFDWREGVKYHGVGVRVRVLGTMG